MAQRRFLRTGQGRKHYGTHIERTVQDGVPRVVLGRKMRGAACLITGLQRKKRPLGDSQRQIPSSLHAVSPRVPLQ